MLFNDTILHNLRYGKLDATMEEVEAAAEAAQVMHFQCRLCPFGTMIFCVASAALLLRADLICIRGRLRQIVRSLLASLILPLSFCGAHTRKA